MTQVGNVYGQALYSLVKDEGLSAVVLEELKVLKKSFSEEPEFVRLLAAANLSKEERCQILDDSFRGKIQPYVLNFLKILTEKGYIRQFFQCCETFESQFNLDHGILPVKAVTAIPLTKEQTEKLTKKLSGITGKTVIIENQVDADCIGGVRLDFDGKRLDDTVAHRLEAIGGLLKNTVL
ncbi:MAG: ATP synthase F1 subunit delta [Lachnospiraceae bacterium]|nr:ATP synthase F1 subunit delta [Lachnospiraceae bacterium]